ncbi:DUF2514 family protein [Variovorax sp. J22R193]|uniref:DUF2514 family protein n=1 Tax=Variovorax fucosicus TaxID=3053517 RepID=UPI002575C19D|nr:DUF2514 family protein [Variovorax sp. J22R193]MDM0041892.1 DUF2514 family protein [Variovorax sp. J22R193]
MMALMSPKVWIALAFAGLLAIIGLQQVRVSNWRAAEAAARASLAADRATYAQAAQIAEQAARAEESRRNEATRKVVSDAHIETAAAKDAAGAAERAAVELRQRLASLIATGRKAASNPSAPGRSPGDQGGDALDLFAGVFSRVDGAAGELAAYADALKVAGQGCERFADSLQ